MDRNAALDKLVDAGTIQSFDKTLYFKKFAIQWKAALEESPDFEIGYRNTKTGTNETQLVSSASVIKTIDKLTSNYDFYLTSIGWTKETIEEFNKNVAKLKEGVDSYKGLKEEIKVSDLVSPNKNTIAEFDALFNKTLAETFGVMPKEEFGKLSIYEQNTKKANQNEYIESSERLASNRLNFSNLILPNSAKKLQDLSIEIVNATGQTVFNYSDPKNMLDRNFMSNLRHSFITGKYAIGIAAVNQTNHSLNQRQPIFIDLSKLENIDPKDKMWIGDAKLKFFNEDGEQNFNTIMINGVEVVTQSMVLTKSGDYISDIISQFIDGYVDIAKDPWIMQLGATPNVAGTWLFLIKSGVPVDQVAYFMNQPIIRDYLRTLENAGYTWLFNDKMVVEVMSGYKIGKESIEITSIPTNLKDTLGKETFSPKENAEQRFILTEFLKYAKIAQHLFYVTQGSNFDTANFNDPTLVFKKEMQLTKAQNSIFSSVDDKNSVVSAVDAILNNSFLQVLRVYIGKSKNALAEILISDKKRVRSIIQTALMPYVDLPDREFVKIAQKMTNDFFDWAVQTIPKTKKGATLNSLIEDALIKDDSYVEQLSEFVEGIRSNPKHALYNNQVIKVLEPIFSDRVGDKLVNNIKIKNKESNIYDQNQIIYAFKELKTYLSSSRTGLYKKLVTVAVLQSGLSTSPISFTSLLPYDDFKDEYNLILSKLETLPNLEVFNTLDVFSRNNWSNDDIVPRMKARLIIGEEENYYNTAMNFLPTNVKNAVNKEEIPPVISVSIGSKEANYEIIVYQWEDESFSLNERRAMRERGDFSYIKKGLFKKVKDGSGSPLVYESGSVDNPYVNYVYQAINAWGDSYRANEFYNKGQQSVIETNFIQVEEVDPSKILPYFVNRGYLLTSEGKLPNVVAKETPTQTIPIQKATKVSTNESELIAEEKAALDVLDFVKAREIRDKIEALGKEIKPKGRPAIKNRNQNNCK
jgi:hypothetical protein